MYKHGVRVIILTANMIYCDCNNKSQGMWHQDFPLKTHTGTFSIGLICAVLLLYSWSSRSLCRGSAHLLAVLNSSVDYENCEAKGKPLFERQLVEYLSALQLPTHARTKLLEALSRFDFSGARVQLVASVPGYHSGTIVTKPYVTMSI